MNGHERDTDSDLWEQLPGIVEMLRNSRVRELEVDDGDVSLHIRRGGSSGDSIVLQDARVEMPGELLEVVKASALPSNVRQITAPIVGVFYHAEQPGRAPLVTEGERIERGALIGVIEALQVMTEVETDAAGIVRQVLAPDGQSVEYGQPLIEVLIEA